MSLLQKLSGTHLEGEVWNVVHCVWERGGEGAERVSGGSGEGRGAEREGKGVERGGERERGGIYSG